MSEQAIETEDEIITETEIDNTASEETTIDAVAEIDEEVEIVVEGEDKPASKSQRSNGFKKRIDKLNSKVSAANTATDEVTRRAEMLEEENKLLRLQAQSVKPTSRPDEDSFDTRAEYLAALDEYDNERITKAAQKQVAEYATQSQTQTTLANQDAKLEASLGEHYERANTLKMKNYEELEDKAIDVLGNDLSKVIMANTEKSHLIMAHLGANPAKAAELVELVKVNPVKALVKAVEIGNSLSIKPKTQIAPDPETTVDSGVSVSYNERGPKGATYK
jgi:hypothetical protein